MIWKKRNFRVNRFYVNNSIFMNKGDVFRRGRRLFLLWGGSVTDPNFLIEWVAWIAVKCKWWYLHNSKTQNIIYILRESACIDYMYYRELADSYMIDRSMSCMHSELCIYKRRDGNNNNWRTFVCDAINFKRLLSVNQRLVGSYKWLYVDSWRLY